MGLFRFLFMQRKHLVHTAFGNDMYFQAVNKLSSQGISHDAVLKREARFYSSDGHSDIPMVRNALIDNTRYDFYVKKEDQHRAQQALH